MWLNETKVPPERRAKIDAMTQNELITLREVLGVECHASSDPARVHEILRETTYVCGLIQAPRQGMENEIKANELRVRRNEIEGMLLDHPGIERARELLDELAEIGNALDRLNK